ncbi:MAG: sigma-54 dependent transcriptional regulator [Candidatus Cloacimonadaceae bacterium]
MTKLNILIVDDEPRIREELCEFLQASGYHCFEAGTPIAAMHEIQHNSIDLVILDINLPQKDGITVLKEIKELDDNIEVLMITGQGDMDLAIRAMRNGAADFFNKPINPDEVLQSIERTKRYLKLSKQCRQVQISYDRLFEELSHGIALRLIGESKTMRILKREIESAAQNPDVSVLITGESGTGKELVARSIHYLSERKNKCFYAVNCAAIPEALFESEFFGYVKGAFTGAGTDKQGWFEAADKGTLFLDEIADMQAFMQAKLLRVTEDGKVHRLGSNRDLNVDVRIISATNRNIVHAVNRGTFRQDLFHRLNTFQINIPPLRERPEDIPILVEHFVRHFAQKTGKAITEIEAAVLDILLQHPLKGNVRELKNILERAIIACDEDKLKLKHFHDFNLHSASGSQPCGKDDDILDLEILEKNAIIKALKQTKDNKTQAAKLLNISWQALERRIVKYGLE